MCYVKQGYGPGTSFTEVQAHPLHIVASCDLARLYVDSSTDSAVVDDVPDVIADLVESNVLALERVAREVLAGEPEGSAGAHSPNLEVAGIFGLREAAWIQIRRRLPTLGWEVAAGEPVTMTAPPSGVPALSNRNIVPMVAAWRAPVHGHKLAVRLNAVPPALSTIGL